MKSDVPFNSLKTSERTHSMSDVIGLCCRCGLIYFDVFGQFPRDLQWLFIERDLKRNIPSDEEPPAGACPQTSKGIQPTCLRFLKSGGDPVYLSSDIGGCPTPPTSLAVFHPPAASDQMHVTKTFGCIENHPSPPWISFFECHWPDIR